MLREELQGELAAATEVMAEIVRSDRAEREVEYPGYTGQDAFPPWAATPVQHRPRTMLTDRLATMHALAGSAPPWRLKALNPEVAVVQRLANIRQAETARHRLEATTTAAELLQEPAFTCLMPPEGPWWRVPSVRMAAGMYREATPEDGVMQPILTRRRMEQEAKRRREILQELEQDAAHREQRAQREETRWKMHEDAYCNSIASPGQHVDWPSAG